MTNELRDVLTEALVLHQWRGDFLGCGCGWNWPEERTYFCGEDERIAKAHAAHVADVLLSLPGVAVIQLPEPEVIQGEPRWNDGNVWTGGSGKVRAYLGDARMTAASARELAADLLAAAAVVAEGEDK
ncbi:hypothetical protein SEA_NORMANBULBIEJR_80 [Mycobacterium phage NormanBulbieJr]|uniref:Uncharacterized protein n=2 Tax=Cheoctovirus TaxID=1623281 RepID=Q855B8_9CAUD|nr:hypothetical protein PBI_CHE8_92 [Mycobacterium phage Che8]YP_009961700.1 hypothetical protein I5H82_gp082 [Mycobacterium phage Priscilla]AWY03694.1 hypothetical protein SEA_KOELLA_74 [Mycobacterium phage Koella]AXC38343.1 hypothetical protein SEA_NORMANBULBIEJR_80 [Mycobacterium phage NormanBulbieJr]AAN12490.1 hypothetical protein PBI_CHE8_92 [Mycobacterium phage Che8]AVI04336.1 hypothetical protein SEA_PRISCILLA_82 [Mycobacterium phage Priscilla]